MTDEPVLIYTLFGSGAEAKQVAGNLIEEKLIACANHLAPASSQYVWKGETCENEEYPVLLKTVASRSHAAMARLRALHSYDLPAILSWPASQSDPDYARWLSGQMTDN
jgi:periplasmic divalent cation tolerance protein